MMLVQRCNVAIEGWRWHAVTGEAGVVVVVHRRQEESLAHHRTRSALQSQNRGRGTAPS